MKDVLHNTLVHYKAYERTTHAGWRSDTPYASELGLAKAAADCIPELLQCVATLQAEVEAITDDAQALAETEFYAQRDLQNKVSALEKELAHYAHLLPPL